VEFVDAVTDLCDWGATAFYGDSSCDFGEEHRVTFDVPDGTLAEAWCRLLVATGHRIGFIIRDGRVWVASIDHLVGNAVRSPPVPTRCPQE
jgi:hypothetical protein